LQPRCGNLCARARTGLWKTVGGWRDATILFPTDISGGKPGRSATSVESLEEM